jgi:hypothetical protein
MTEERQPTTKSLVVTILLCFIFASASVLAPYHLTKFLAGEKSAAHLLDYSFSLIIILPLVQGIFIGFRLAEYKMRARNTFLVTLLAYSLNFIAATFIYLEGYICLLMAAPIYFALIYLGMWIGRGIKGLKKSKTIQVSVIPLIFAAVAFDTSSTSPVYSNAISDAVTINATPEEVWQFVVQYPENKTPPEYWLWKIGLPTPIQSVATGKALGEKRECRFTNGVVFEEKITEITPAKVLTFDITKQPEHPEIIGHFSLDKGQMYLERNPDGTTTIIATSWYRLYVRPAKYFDWWAEDIVRNVHFRVLNHIKALSEANKTLAVDKRAIHS